MTNIDFDLTCTNQGTPRDVTLVAAVNPDGSAIGGGGGSGAATEATQLEVLMILNELNTDFGIPSQAAWTGTGDGTVIAILKALHAQNVQIIAALQAIQANTATP